jgi:hypothetical protein
MIFAENKLMYLIEFYGPYIYSVVHLYDMTVVRTNVDTKGVNRNHKMKNRQQ